MLKNHAIMSKNNNVYKKGIGYMIGSKLVFSIFCIFGFSLFLFNPVVNADDIVDLIVTAEDVVSDRSRFYVEGDTVLLSLDPETDSSLAENLSRLNTENNESSQTNDVQDDDNNDETIVDSNDIDHDALADAKKENVGSEVTQFIDETAAQKVITEAKKHLGVNYVWGGKTPSGFDCSGFTQYIFRHALGLEIGEWTLPQSQKGERIDVADAKPGDLYFWGEGTPRHVALAIGEDTYIHAPQPGEQVRYNTTSWYMPDYAIRIID